MSTDSAREHLISRALYPEVGAGGFSHVDGTVQFYTRVNALLDPSMTIADFGAGRGEWARDPIEFRRNLRSLRGKVREVIGIDIDRAVEDNPSIDRHLVCPDLQSIALPSESVDIVVSDHTFEHIDLPGECAKELTRILKPGGWICARTPNRWGCVALGASLVPNTRHVRALARLQPQRDSVDVFPTRYRLNTQREVSRYFPDAGFADYSYYWAGDPSYYGRSTGLARLIRLTSSGAPRRLKPKLFVFLRKNG